MRRDLLQVCLLVGSLSVATLASAQQTVHALAGRVAAIYPATNTIKIVTDDGTPGFFDVLTKTNTPLTFQKSVKAMSTPAASFTKPNCEVVVFYIGDDNIRTTVALEDLGAAPLEKVTGTVVGFDKHTHLLTIKNATGTEQAIHITPKTVAEAPAGVVSGDGFDARKGDQVRITATAADGAETALFVRTL